jgi:hypothetical protein
MYVLIGYYSNGYEHNEMVASTKKRLLQYLKENNYSFSKKHNRYIHAKNRKTKIAYYPECIIKKAEDLSDCITISYEPDSMTARSQNNIRPDDL